MPLPTIFCHQCDTLILGAEACSACNWQRPSPSTEVGHTVWAIALDTKLPSKESPVAVASGTVYFPTENGSLITLSAYQTEDAPPIPWRYESLPKYKCHGAAIWQDYIIPGQEYQGGFPFPQGELVLLSTEDGNEVWHHPLDAASWSVPAVFENVAYLTTNAGWLFAIDLEKRQELWRHQIPKPWSWAPSAPCITAEGLAILPARSESLAAFDLKARRVRWTFSADGWFPHSPQVAGETAFVRCWDSHVYAIDVKTGQKRWQHKAPRDYSSDLSLGREHVYIGAKDYANGTESGSRTYALYTLNAETGQRVGRYEVSGRIYGRPAISSEGVLFATDDRSRATPSQGTLYALDQKGQYLLWEPCVTEYRFQSDLALVDDLVIAGTRQGAVYGIRWRAVETTPQAPQIYLDDENWEDAAIAYALQGNYLQAGDLYAKKLNTPLQAARLYRKADAPERVISVLKDTANDEELAFAVETAQSLPTPIQQAEALESLRQYLPAAETYQQTGDLIAAGKCYEQAQAWEKAFQVYTDADATERWQAVLKHLKDGRGLAERHTQAGKHDLAAAIYLETGLFAEAGRHYELAHQPDEALSAYRKLPQESRTPEIHQQMAALAEQTGHIDLAIDAHEALGALLHAAQLAEQHGRFTRALTLYRELNNQQKVGEMLEKLNRFAEAAKVFVTARQEMRAAQNFERQVEAVIEKAGSVRYVDDVSQLEKWLERAIGLYENKAAYSQDNALRDQAYTNADRCQMLIMKLNGQPLLHLSVTAQPLQKGQSNAVNYTVQNRGWGTAEELWLTMKSNAIRYPEQRSLGSLRPRQNASGTLTIVPEMLGQITLEFMLEGSNNVYQNLAETITVAAADHYPSTAQNSLDVQQNVGVGSRTLRGKAAPDFQHDLAVESQTCPNCRQLMWGMLKLYPDAQHCLHCGANLHSQSPSLQH